MDDQRHNLIPLKLAPQLFAVVLMTSTCPAQQLVSATREEATPQRTTPTLLVLVDGKVIHGQLVPRPDGYDVTTRAGRMFISSDRVRLTASDLDDAWQRLRDSQTTKTPETHVELAQWCLRNQRPDFARRELLDALRLDPNREDARRMLTSLEKSSLPESDASAIEPVRRWGPPVGVESRSLAGLPREVAQEFTRHVQPLLMNKCGMSGCHGSRTSSGFQLQTTHRGSSPTVAERNLAAVLGQIDLADPEFSPLLKLSETAHGDESVPPLRGRAGNVQRQTLRDWVMSISDELAPASKDVVVNAAAVESHGGIRRTSLEQTEAAHGMESSTKSTDARFLNEARRALVRDDFSPDEFNRQHHGMAASRGDSRTESKSSDVERVADDDRPVNQIADEPGSSTNE